MPPKGNAPGLKRGRHSLPYWIAAQVTRDTMGFPDKCIPLPPDADLDTLAELCRQHTARLKGWIDERTSEAEPGQPALPRYDGTVYSACQLYQRHPRSKFHKVKRNTRKTYGDSLKVIELTVGRRLIRNLTVLDIEHWYEEWRKPATPEKDPETGEPRPLGPERIDRAHDAVAMFRTVLRFCAALRHADCKQLIAELDLVKFERGGAREAEMTYAHATAFIRTALDLGRREVIPAQRGLYMAIGVAAQFELLLRQKDIIGEWDARSVAAESRVHKDAVRLIYGEEFWAGFFCWEKLPGWRWRTRTSKSKYRSAAEFDLTIYSLLFPLLEQVPHDERVGAVVKGEGGLPIRERSYRKWYRQIARAAGIPDEIWNMDSRAGGATEAEDSGATIDQIQSALTHTRQETTLRYIRRRTKKIADVAEARRKAREGTDDAAT